MTNQDKIVRIVELVKSAVENRSNKDWTLMHLDLNEAYELASQLALPAGTVPEGLRDEVAKLVLAAHNVTQSPTPAFVGVLGDRARSVAALMSSPAVAQPVADERDAQRYRWLRSQCAQEHHSLLTVQHELDGIVSGADLDAAIDAARAALCQPAEGGKA